MMQRRMMKLQSSGGGGGGMNGSGVGGGGVAIPSSNISTSQGGGGPQMGGGWVQPPSQSPSLMGGHQPVYGSSQIQQHIGGGIQSNQVIPSNMQQQSHLRLNGPAEFHRMKKIFLSSFISVFSG